MKHCLLLLLTAVSAFAQTATDTPAKVFDTVADTALQAMVRRANELGIKGAAVLAYIHGETTTAWTSKMVIVGSLKVPPTEKNKGANLLAIAYTKACEMADSLKDSGKAGRPPMTGETGWEGGLIRKTKTGYLLAAFSGGPSDKDLKVAEAGLDALAGKL